MVSGTLRDRFRFELPFFQYHWLYVASPKELYAVQDTAEEASLYTLITGFSLFGGQVSFVPLCPHLSQFVPICPSFSESVPLFVA